uniref:Uncharacterized protein n=1 Tax=viral metagenome TaxID=1070528 RepID=A0A6M3KNG3_9ZZZZ
MPLSALYRTQGPPPEADPTKPFFPESWKKAMAKVPLSVGPGRAIQKAMGKKPEGPNLRDAFEMAIPQSTMDVVMDMLPVAALATSQPVRKLLGKAGKALAGGGAEAATEAGAKALGKKMKYVAPEIASKKVKKVWHVSPHKFDKFDFSAGKAGTGTGGQMQGAGGYFAESDAVKRHYQDLFASQAGPYKMPREVRDALGVLDYLGFDTPEQAMHGIRQEGKKWTQVWDADPEKLRKQYPKDAEAVDVIENYRANPPAREKPYHTYESLIPAEDDYLLWDAPLSEQSDKVKKALEKLGQDTDALNMSDKQLYSRAKKYFDGSRVQEDFAEDIGMRRTVQSAHKEFLKGPAEFRQWIEGQVGTSWVVRRMVGTKASDKLLPGYAIYDKLVREHGSPQKVSELLSSKGVRGNKYLDAGSRNITPEYRVIDGDTGEPIYSAVERSEAEKWINSLGPGKGKGDGLTIQKFERPATYNYVVFDEKDADIIKMLASVAPLLAARATGKKKAEAPKP